MSLFSSSRCSESLRVLEPSVLRLVVDAYEIVTVAVILGREEVEEQRLREGKVDSCRHLLTQFDNAILSPWEMLVQESGQGQPTVLPSTHPSPQTGPVTRSMILGKMASAYSTISVN